MAKKEVRDREGRILYTVDESSARHVVQDRSGRVIGSVADGNTYDAQGRFVARGDAPGILVNPR